MTFLKGNHLAKKGITGIYPRTEKHREAIRAGLNKPEVKKKLSLAAKGQHRSPKTEFKAGIHRPEKCKENPSYRAIHEWVSRWKGKPETCEVCGKTNLKGRKIGWANINHSYRRVLEDYIRMCLSCHIKYDIRNNFKRLPPTYEERKKIK